MPYHVCPPWVGYLLLLNPVRKILENPNRILGPLVQEGMVVLEPGCAMGYFTLPLARMVGSSGRVLAVDIQPKMLSILVRRAQKAGLADRILCREADQKSLFVDDFSGRVDLTVAIHVVHEIPDQSLFFAEVCNALKPGGKLLVVEPKHHVSQDAFAKTLGLAENSGFQPVADSGEIRGRVRLLLKPSAVQ